MIIYEFDKRLQKELIYSKDIKFKREDSFINCLVYINNLIIKAILKSLSLSTYKDAYTFFNRVKE